MNISTDSNILFKELMINYLSFIKMEVKESSYITKENVINLHILPFFEKLRAREITSRYVIKWKKDMIKKGLSFEYLSKAYNNLSAIFKHGVDHYGLRENPCKKAGNFKNPGKIKKEIQYWLFDEFQEFISNVDDIKYKTFFMFLYYMGTRKGETMAIRWKDVDFKKHQATITKTVTEKTTEGGWKLTDPKTLSSIRTILIPQALLKQLKIYLKWFKEFDLYSEEDFVFGKFRPWPSTTIARNYEKYLNQTKLKKIKIHDLRHSHASLLINQGASILVVSKRLGHKDVNET